MKEDVYSKNGFGIHLDEDGEIVALSYPMTWFDADTPYHVFVKECKIQCGVE